MEGQVFYGQWSDIDGLKSDFEIKGEQLDGAEVLFAWYEYANYEGDAYVLYRKDGKLYEVHGGHCSCYGLEGQWIPDEVPLEALKERLNTRNERGYRNDYDHILRPIVNGMS